MKKLYFFITILSIIQLTITHPPLVEVIFAPTNNSSSTLTNSVKQNSRQTYSATTSVQSDAHEKNFLDFLHEQYKISIDHGQSMFIWIQNNKIKATIYTLLLFYSAIMCRIYDNNLIINDDNAWSRWQSSRSLEDLCATPHNILESELLFVIQTTYTHPTNPTDFVYPLVQASTALSKEINTLQEQIKLYRLVDTCHSLQLFFLNHQSIIELEEKYRKLIFIKHIFSSWSANYRIEKNS